MTTTTTTTTLRAFNLPVFDYADWLIRLSVAATFIYHGATKFPNISAGAEMMGMPFLIWFAVAAGEIAAGLAIVAGGVSRGAMGDILTRLGGLGVAVIMVGAIALVHWGQWANAASETHPIGGMEFQTLLLATGLFFALRGNRA